MKSPEGLAERLHIFEDILVKQLSACHALHDLAQDEQAALSTRDTDRLSNLVEQEEALLDELNRLEDARRGAAQALSLSLGLAAVTPTVAEILPAIEAETAGRLGRLREGILALLSQVKDLARGNLALAGAGLEQVVALQAFLLGLVRLPAAYDPRGKVVAGNYAPALEIDQRT